MTDSAPPPPPLSVEPQNHVSHGAENAFRSPSLIFAFLRICLYLSLVYVLGYGLQRVSSLFGGRDPSPFAPGRLASGEIALLASRLVAAWIMSLLERRSFAAYGLPLRGAFGRLFWLGALFGLAEISAVVGFIAPLGSYHFGSIELMDAAQLLRWMIFWAVFFLVVGLYEEFEFRGYVQFTLAQGLRFWPAALLLSLVFGAVHISNPGETWAGIVGIFLTGLFWCFTLRRTGSLWFAVGMHASFDFGETFLYSVPNSGVVFPGHLSSATLAGPSWITGGTAGPEGSIFDFVLLLLFFLVVHRLFPRPSTEGPKDVNI